MPQGLATLAVAPAAAHLTPPRAAPAIVYPLALAWFFQQRVTLLVKAWEVPPGWGSSFGRQDDVRTLAHRDEYNFTQNKYYHWNTIARNGTERSSEFSIQMVIHPIGPTTGQTQTLAATSGEWKLVISKGGTLNGVSKLAVQ